MAVPDRVVFDAEPLIAHADDVLAEALDCAPSTASNYLQNAEAKFVHAGWVISG